LMSGSADVVVVGAGIVGCAVADELARRGASVQIVDERATAMGATQASAGVLAPYIEARPSNPLLDLTVRSLGMYEEFVARVMGDSGATVVYKRTGTLDVATDQTEWADLQAAAQFLQSREVPALLLDSAATLREEPHLGEGTVGGLLVDEHGFVA